MLDEIKVNEPEEEMALQCEICGLWHENKKDRDHIDNTGLCRSCDNKI